MPVLLVWGHSLRITAPCSAMWDRHIKRKGLWVQRHRNRKEWQARKLDGKTSSGGGGKCGCGVRILQPLTQIQTWRLGRAVGAQEVGDRSPH